MFDFFWGVGVHLNGLGKCRMQQVATNMWLIMPSFFGNFLVDESGPTLQKKCKSFFFVLYTFQTISSNKKMFCLYNFFLDGSLYFVNFYFFSSGTCVRAFRTILGDFRLRPSDRRPTCRSPPNPLHDSTFFSSLNTPKHVKICLQ